MMDISSSPTLGVYPNYTGKTSTHGMTYWMWLCWVQEHIDLDSINGKWVIFTYI